MDAGCYIEENRVNGWLQFTVSNRENELLFEAGLPCRVRWGIFRTS
jgi:hypothetical protein